MEQIAVSFTDWWTPKTWLTPTITILDRAWNIYVEDWELKELGYWWYIYNFDNYSPQKVYLYLFDGWDSLSWYDRYIFGGNEFDAYSNKYSWGRTAAPYFTQLTDWITWKFTKSEKLIKALEKKIKNYDDKDLLSEIDWVKRALRDKYLDTDNKLKNIWSILQEIKQSIVDTSSTNDWNNSKSFWWINWKLDLLADYITQFRGDVNDELSILDDNVAQRILDSTNNLNNNMSNRVTIEQLLQQVERLEDKLNKVVDTVVSEKLPKEIRDEYDVNVSRKKKELSDEEIMEALWIGWEFWGEEEWLWIEPNMWNQYWLNQWMSEWIDMWMEEGMEEGMEDWLWLAREGQSAAPVDMQGIAEPTMPLWAL